MKNVLVLLILFGCTLNCSKDEVEIEGDNGGITNYDLYTYIPDDAFEKALIRRGLDDIEDHYVLTSNIKDVEELIFYGCSTGWGGASCGGIGIKDLTGIEDFINLKILNVTGNGLKTLDVSYNTELISLGCADNELTMLDVSNNLKLESLACYGNEISELDLSNNVMLKNLSIGNYVYQYLGGINIIYLDLSHNINLERLDCTNNKLTGIDISNCNKLEFISLHRNNLSTLDVSSVDNLRNLWCTQNPLLECIQVNESQLNYRAFWYTDPGVTYSLDCNN